jgi:hypothetical protein
VRLARRLAYERLVFGGTPGMRARVDDELTVAPEHTFAARQRVLDQLRGRQVFPQVGRFEFLRSGKNRRSPRCFRSIEKLG